MLRSYLTRWQGILGRVTDGRILRSMFIAPDEQKKRDEIEWPYGLREEFNGMVHQRIGQLGVR